MLGRLAAAAALIASAACAGVESAGRNARGPNTVAAASPRPAPTVTAPAVAAPAPTQMAAAVPPPAPAPRATEPQAQPPPPPAPSVAQTSAPSRPVTPNVEDDEVVVPGQVERQVRPPQGDPRSNSERMQDINAWDRCVTHVQAAYERDPMRPQLQSPEEYCAQSLGMSDRTAVPESRRD